MFQNKNNLFQNVALLSGVLVLSGFSTYSLIKSVKPVNAVAPCIITISGVQYDVGPLTVPGAHAGGNVFVCGTDMTALFMSMPTHATDIARMAPYVYIAPTATPTPTVAPTVTPTATVTPTVTPTTTPEPSVSPTATPTVNPTVTPTIGQSHDDDRDEIEDEQGENETNHNDLDDQDENNETHESEHHDSDRSDSNHHNPQIKAGSREHHED